MDNRLQASVDRVKIKGFRSFESVDVLLSDLTVMIGANGSGKSNFIRFFEMLSWMLVSRKLEEFVQRQGGADDQLYCGNKITPRLEAEVNFRTEKGTNDYKFSLSWGHPDRFLFTEEAFRYSAKEYKTDAKWISLESGHREAKIVEVENSPDFPGNQPKTAKMIVNFLRNCHTFQFHDTSEGSPFKTNWDADENIRLRSHGGNLSAVLHRLEQEDVKRFDAICRHIRRVLPAFDRFEIEESFGKVSLRWKSKLSDKTIGAHLTSDGSLRFFALVTLLSLPPEFLPDVILLDEPELGLHPAAIVLVGELIKVASREKQVIVATQSPLLVDAFQLENILVLDLEDDRSIFKQLDPDKYSEWLAEGFTTGEMWQKNLLGGRP